ncbi:T9SS type A sorting domain-containing protein [Brumimicrobium glaciale]|uniref:T9SS type A sorting domain-containing protein n=1 Tax=Brumimicrobium glaciale TaxID=200475 RepID=A0A4Q4KQU9_9FLAO|nr:fibronectin type III domain-containing protein [Brumimicrobium glaciale]RYM35777.1 T9SS type A sorting domain-containing protein [Brumimicrobium glaciale]
MNKFYKKLRNLGLAFLVAGSFANYTSAQFGCATGVAITNGYTATAITTPGTGGVEDWNINPPGSIIPGYWWDDDVYMFEYTAGATAEEITMTIFTRKTYTGIGVFSTCTGTQFSNQLDAVGDFAANAPKTVSAIISPAQTVYIAVGQWGTPNDLDFDVTNFSVTTITCPDPTNLLSSAITSGGATVDWTENGTATTWNIEWGLAGYTPGSMAAIGSDMGNTSQTSVITGLNPATTYDVYVQSDCGGGDLSAWVGPLTFFTTCLAETTPWFYDVEASINTTSSQIGNCWSSSPNNTTSAYRWDVGGSTSSTATGPNSAYSGSKFFYTEASSGVNGATAYLYTPLIDLSGLTVPQLGFYYHMYGSDINVLNVQVSTDNGVTWTTEGTITGQQQISGNDPWIEELVLLNSYSGIISLRFEGIRGGSFNGDISLDDISVKEAPTCIKPSNLAVTNVTSTSVDLSWTENNGSSLWNLEYGVAGFSQGAGTQANAITTNPYAITITPNTAYEFYIQTDCGGGDLSEWAGPFAFSNVYCLPVYTSTSEYLPLIETVGAIADVSHTASAFPAPNGYTDETAQILEVYETLTFDLNSAYNPSNYSYVVRMWVDFNNDFVFDHATELISSASGGPGSFTQQVTIPAGTPVGTYRVRVRGEYSASADPFPCSSETWGSAADFTMSVITPPTCLPVMDIDTVSVSTTSIELSWTELNTATSWTIEYGLAGFTQGNGMFATANTNLGFTISGLNPSAQYDFYIQADCGGGDLAAWRGPFSMYTDCGIAVAPFYEGFSNAVQPQCWENLSSNTSTSVNNFWKFNGQAGYAAANNGRTPGTFAWVDGDFPYGDSVILISPQIDISQLATPYLSFEWFSNNTNTPGDNVPLIIEVNDGTSWTLLDTLRGDSPNWEFVNYDLSAFTGNVIQVRFMVNKSVTTGLSYYNDILLDEFRVADCISLGGQDGMFDVCRLDSTVNLEANIIVKPNGGGMWSFPGQPAYVVDDTVFNVQFLPAGAYEVYYVERYVCYDTTTATINVFGPSSAGIDGTINVCKNEPVNLYGVLGGNVDIGGVWYDFTNSALPNSQPKAEPIPGQYNYTYVVTNGVCPADTSIVEVGVLDSCDFLAIGAELFTDISVYPNPTMNILNIVNPSNTSSLKLEMFDMNGRLVLVENKALSNATEATIAIDHLEKGIYTLRVYNDNGQKTFKIVKQ